MYRKSKVRFLPGFLAVVLLSASLTAFSRPEQATGAQPANAITSRAAPGNIIIGAEYCSPGMASAYSDLGITGVKHYPEAFKWNKMQRTRFSKINFKAMDRYVTEYQENGFSSIDITLVSTSLWASKNYFNNFCPKDSCMGFYEKWVGAVVERYDGDGIGDMPGLKFPVSLIEIGSEFSSYEPEPVSDYIRMLERAYQAAHAASANVKVLHAAFLPALAFTGNPGPGDYEAAFAAVDKRIMFRNLADIRQILDRPDIFDMANFHALCGTDEIEQAVRWLNYEMNERGYDKPVMISDTCVNTFSGYGSAMTLQGKPSALSVLIPPAKESDRARLKTYFLSLINKDKTALDWVHAYCASDVVKKVVIAAEQQVYAINTAFMEEYEPSKSRWFGAAAGNASWSGMTLTGVKAFSSERVIKETRPAFYALKQLASHLNGYDTVEKVPGREDGVRVYKVTKGGSFFYIAWNDPGVLLLPGDSVPAKTVSFSDLGGRATVEETIRVQGQTGAAAAVYETQGGILTTDLTYFPVYIFPG